MSPIPSSPGAIAEPRGRRALGTLAAFVAAFTIFRVAAAAHTGVFWDEAYYWDWSRFLAFSYFDHPPMVALWIRGSTALFGDGAFGIRIPFVLVGAALPAVVYATGRILFDRPVACRAALWSALTPLFAIAGILATPDPPAVLLWALAILCLALVAKTGRGVWWLAVGVSAGLGIVAKYTVLFLGLGIVLTLAVDRDLRRWLLSPWIWAGGALALLIALPVVLWDFHMGGGAFGMQFARTETGGFEPEYFLRLIVAQPFAFNAFAFVFAAMAIWGWLKRKDMPWRREIGILVATSAPLVVFLTLHSLRAQVLQHWLAPVYPALTLAAAAAAGFSVESDKARRWLRRIRAAVVPVGFACAVLALAYASLPVDRFVGFDPLKVLRGWPQWADDVDAAREKAGATWIASLEYDVNAELVYQLRGRGVPAVQIFERPRYAYAPKPDPKLLGERAILLVPAKFRYWKFWRPCFADTREVGRIIRRSAGPVLDETVVFIAEGAKPELFTAGCGHLPKAALIGSS